MEMQVKVKATTIHSELRKKVLKGNRLAGAVLALVKSSDHSRLLGRMFLVGCDSGKWGL